MQEPINVGDQAYLADGDEEFGAVREVRSDSVVVYVENGGDFVIPNDAVRAVHSKKVVFVYEKLESKLQAAIRHAHDAEATNDAEAGAGGD